MGKTYIAQAAGLQACSAGKNVLFMSVSTLLENQVLARSNNAYLKFREKLIKPDLLILDDFGMRKFNSMEAEDLRELLEERSYGKSTVITTQLPLDHWPEVLPDPVIADAIIDRLDGLSLQVKITVRATASLRQRSLIRKRKGSKNNRRCRSGGGSHSRKSSGFILRKLPGSHQRNFASGIGLQIL